MKTNTMTLNQLDRGLEVCPQAKDRALSALVMRSTPPPLDDVNPAFPCGAYADEEDTISNAIAKGRASINAANGLLMAGLI